MNKPWLKFYDEGVPHHIEYPDVPLYEFLENSTRKYPNNTAIYYFGTTLTYKQLHDLTLRFAGALQSLGLKKGDRVAIMLPNCPQFLIAFYGALKAGCIVVQTNPLYVERELIEILGDSRPDTIVTIDILHKRIESVVKEIPLKNVIYTSIDEYFPPLLRMLYRIRLALERRLPHIKYGRGVFNLKKLLKSVNREPYDVEINPKEDVALLQYTGGTTGTPKGAMLTHYNLVVNTIQCVSWNPIRKEGEEVVMGALPFFHVYGMTVAMNYSVYVGGKLILLPKFDVRRLVKLLARERVTLFPGAPTMYIAVINTPGVEKYNLKSIRACISGSAPLPVKVKEDFENLTGAKLVEGYGLSEASPVTHCNPIYGLNKPGSIGVPFPDTEAKIVDVETGNTELETGEIGELIVSGPQVMKGYWNRPDETERVLRDGWLYTGDIAKMDEDGYFYIVDRKKDMIISGGFNIYPREIEEVLYQHPGVKEAAVVGVPHSYRGEVPKAYIVPKEGYTLTEQEIKEHCRKLLAKYKVPKYIEFREELPKTFVGKVLKRKLRYEKTGGENA